MKARIPAYATACRVLLLVASFTITVAAKSLPVQQDNSNSTAEPQPADGRRHGRPAELYAVAPGTKFLVVLEQDLTTKDTQENAKFVVRTVEPLEAGSGIYLPAGAEVHGHVSRVESAGTTGRGKIWLTFDDIYTKFGKLPIVAEVVNVPGDHSVKPRSANQEGLIEGRSSTQPDAAQAAAAGAAGGAVQGVKNKDKKEAAEGAALGGPHRLSGRIRSRTRIKPAQGRQTGIGVGAGFVSVERMRREVVCDARIRLARRPQKLGKHYRAC
ncbi:MAG: hypothetical protein M3P45_05335 [Acidobacteriota bacterium]|nr:hypothetical protein [Acidobacteriota bacterium]